MAATLVNRREINDGNDTNQEVPPSQDMLKYNAYYTTSRSNATLHLGNAFSPAIYYLESELFTLKPWLFLRKGDSKKSPMVSFVRFHLMSRHMLVGRGDCQKDSELTVNWETLERERNILFKSGYGFSTVEGSENGELRRFTWNKVELVTAATIYECVNESGTVVGKLRSGGLFNWKKGGEMEVMKTLDEGLREIILATAMGVYFMEFVNYKSLRAGYGHDKDTQ